MGGGCSTHLAIPTGYPGVELSSDLVHGYPGVIGFPCLHKTLSYQEISFVLTEVSVYGEFVSLL